MDEILFFYSKTLGTGNKQRALEKSMRGRRSLEILNVNVILEYDTKRKLD